MKSELTQVLRKLETDIYIPAHELAVSLGVSEKTVRRRLADLNGVLKKNGANIIAKQKYGYRLNINDIDKYTLFSQTMESASIEMFPTTAQERSAYILGRLLSSDDYIVIDEICEFLYVSRNTITADMQRIEDIIKRYDLEIERKPARGTRIIGSEFNKRLCLINQVVKTNSFFYNTSKFDYEQETIAAILWAVLKESDAQMSETSFQNMVLHLVVSMKRFSTGKSIILPLSKDFIEENKRAGAIAQLLSISIRNKFEIDLPEGEIAYYTVHLAGKISNRMGTHHPHAGLEISPEIDRISMKIIESIYVAFGYDFRNSLDLRMALNQHLVPMQVRIVYGIPMNNPVLNDIRKEYSLAYAMSAHAAAILHEHFGKAIIEDEIGFLAFIFEYALSNIGKKDQKKNIVIVCASGRGSSQLFIYKYQQAFSQYIQNIYECTLHEIDSFDFSKVDYVFTTIPLNGQLPVPVFEVNLFLSSDDEQRVRGIFENEDKSFLHRFFSPDIFFGSIKLKNKEDVLRYMCDQVAKKRRISGQFFESVMKRESLGQTDFGNLAAIPHPFKMFPGKSFVAVGILDRPIWWGHNDVQVVFLLSISNENDNDIQQFYKVTTDLLFDSKRMNSLISNRSFESLIALLSGM